MRIKSITIEGLFGQFTHQIPLNLDQHITIIYGANGIGKTVIFKLIDYLFRRKKQAVYARSYENLDRLLSRSTENPHVVFDKIIVTYQDENIFVVTQGEQDWLVTNQTNQLPLHEQEPYQTLVCFIPHQRLETRQEQVIEKIKGDFERIIGEIERQYYALSQRLATTLTQRVLAKEIKSSLPQNELQQLAQEVTDYHLKLDELGILPLPNKNAYLIPPNTPESDKNILAVNLQDMKTKLLVYDDLYKKLSLFLHLVNEKLIFKELLLIEGYNLTIHDKKYPNAEIPLNKLSSGEQNMINLFYFLLFKCPTDALVLIDEPEISQHIAWQDEFIIQLKQIIALNPFDVIVATHSPDIVNGNWDLTVSLKPQTEEHATT